MLEAISLHGFWSINAPGKSFRYYSLFTCLIRKSLGQVKRSIGGQSKRSMLGQNSQRAFNDGGQWVNLISAQVV